jgi:pimeloyl-ACP methyl ester carboxylesterase
VSAAPTIRYVTADDGTRLALHCIGPAAGPPVLLVPGTFSNHTFWLGTRGTGFGRALAERGFRVHALDHRGHGASQRPRPGDRWRFDDWIRRDVPAVLRALPRPVLLVGHSGGGAAILAALAADPELRPRAAAAVILATPVPWLQKVRRLAAHLIRRGAPLLGRFPARALGLGPDDELPHVMAQWMTWNLTGTWRGDDGTDYVARLAELRLPLFFLAGAGDRVYAPPAAVRALHDLATGAADRTFIECGIDTGFGRDYGHAGIIVDREARDDVWLLVGDWLAARARR